MWDPQIHAQRAAVFQDCLGVVDCNLLHPEYSEPALIAGIL